MGVYLYLLVFVCLYLYFDVLHSLHLVCRLVYLTHFISIFVLIYSCCCHYLRLLDFYYRNCLLAYFDIEDYYTTADRGKIRVPGWSDYAQEKYDIARDAYMSWLYAGKPRSGFYHYTTCKTRSSTVAEILRDALCR